MSSSCVDFVRGRIGGTGTYLLTRHVSTQFLHYEATPIMGNFRLSVYPEYAESSGRNGPKFVAIISGEKTHEK